MDFRAESVLKPADAQQFRFVVFGGILGDHPPQDRAKEFRERFNHIRQLGTVQMTTDTAVLVSHEILEGQQDIENLSFVDDPEVPMDESVVRYLDAAMPLSQMEKQGFDSVREGLAEFKEAAAGYKPENSGDVQRQEATIMEGFRYRVDDTEFPVFVGAEQVNNRNFPIIPVGMLDVWREQEEQGGIDLNDFL